MENEEEVQEMIQEVKIYVKILLEPKLNRKMKFWNLQFIKKVYKQKLRL
ncbi:unnamed protein product [Paramecium pentaurelia]|uniref:Uncharacterized protein n=1 Tax=Paramecium pentaurelia TaxID=43138 RepID=A0A8S1YQP3_9CILI|nr:unnamed protein product [Paramecium pentaurelia]